MNYLTRIVDGDDEPLFRAEPRTDGWCYAFLRSIEKSRGRLVREALPFDLTLFVIEADRRRRYVACLRDVECVDVTQAAALSESADVPAPNLRFRRERAFRYPHEAYASADDRVMVLYRYQMHRAVDVAAR